MNIIAVMFVLTLMKFVMGVDPVGVLGLVESNKRMGKLFLLEGGITKRPSLVWEGSARILRIMEVGQMAAHLFLCRVNDALLPAPILGAGSRKSDGDGGGDRA